MFIHIASGPDTDGPLDLCCNLFVRKHSAAPYSPLAGISLLVSPFLSHSCYDINIWKDTVNSALLNKISSLLADAYSNSLVFLSNSCEAYVLNVLTDYRIMFSSFQQIKLPKSPEDMQTSQDHKAVY